MDTKIRHNRDQPIEILSVEDNSADRNLIAAILKESGNDINLTFAWDGAEAMGYLRREDKYAKAPRPDLILLDLHLPKKDGYTVLAELRRLDEFQNTPVLILATSESSEDKLKCKNLLANAYLTKRMDLDGFSVILRAVDDFCEAISVKRRLELDEESLRKALREEREGRQMEREVLGRKIAILEARIAEQTAKVKLLAEGGDFS